MSFPKEHWENNRLDRGFPLKIFFNRAERVRPGQNILYLHWHEHFEIIVMQAGHAVFHINSCPYEVGPGDALLVPAGDLHIGSSLSDEDVEYIAIVFNAALFSDSAKEPDYERFLKPFLEGKIKLPVTSLLQSELGEEEGIMRLLLSAIHEYKEEKPAHRLLVKTYLLLLFTLLARRHLPHAVSGKSAESLRWMDSIKALIREVEQDLSAKLTLEDAARRVNLNPYHFCKVFKKLTGRTFIDYVNLCRMQEANRLLGDTTDSVTEIAERVGCANPNYFTKLFKQYMGITPSQVRRK